MLGVEDYGSGNESEGERTPQPIPSSNKVSKASGKKKKIAIGLPTFQPTTVDEDEDGPHPEQPPAKKPKLGTGKGSSSLISMLPAPKQQAPPPPAPERVLGAGKGPGLVFNTFRPIANLSSSYTVDDSAEDNATLENPPEPTVAEDEPSTSSTLFTFRPLSIAKGKANVSLEEPRPKSSLKSSTSALNKDFFSLGAGSSSKPSTITAPSLSITSAPEIASSEIPEPSVNDPYPGYYQTSTGEWKQHEVEYYEKFRKQWEKEYNDHIRALEKGALKGFEGYDGDETADVDAAKEMERAKMEIKEREERKAVSKTQGQPAKPKMNITAAKLSGRARSRHQLATLLNEAYENRDALEEKIAEGRRNRKEAGNKYGF
ncbi:hypothetical protein D9757_007748 [Collybiopsis confluens]|uniref:Mitotic checkpoint regulator, MAD2B-interacting-domain-containing protein n=1 Tax=Collybiopsis confluens TaxID=2823264 RepID=A0A8H5H5F1_9AGAR|nr:hypothetical protein D9757_007748 [Collybiopsis confluens]